ncbi:immunity protein Imm33 domain-containing protein [Litoribaculum gwangyangense]|uniref:Imm33-like domain-containing protein n=1 Tax=Litoribaculum gwangyangense TaxID=1130722 RepID=A0ABP9CA76_9FLAO
MEKKIVGIINKHTESQKRICKKYNSDFTQTDEKLFIGIATDLELEPINGLRHPEHGKMNGWYIWSGEWSNADAFFKPLCLEHLIEKKPDIIKYLGLDVGFRFLIDKKGYEDVWFDQNITELK